MKPKLLSKKLSTLILSCIVFIFALQPTHAQTTIAKPLTLIQVLTGLQAKNGQSMLEKNVVMIQQVQAKGVTFKLNAVLEKEMKTAGANETLLQAIRTKNSASKPATSDKKVTSTFRKIWVEQDKDKDGLKGMNIIADFTVYNLKDTKADIVYRFKKNGVYLKGQTTAFKTKTGLLSARRFLTPKYDAAVFDNLTAFLPYEEMGLATGSHTLVMQPTFILRNGKTLKSLPAQTITVVVPAKLKVTYPTEVKSTLNKFWVDYDVTQDGKVGMIVHINITINGQKGKEFYLRTLFSKADGTKLRGATPAFRTKAGHTALFRYLDPKYDAAKFKDVAMFIPYSEFSLPVGTHLIDLKAELINKGNFRVVSQVGVKKIKYTRKK